jgi:hypothetical protein
MQKIGNITTTADANGEWTNGNVAAGTPPTIIDAAWLNTIQREIANVVTNAGLTLDPANDAQLLAALKLGLGPGRLLNFQIFTSSGPWTRSAENKKTRVIAIGAGGAGGSAGTNSSTTISSGSGGGSGSFVDAWFSTIPSSVDIVLGTGGIANISGTGGDGGVTTFGSLISCPGGKGGGINQVSTSNIMSYAGQGAGGSMPTVTGAEKYVATVGQSGTNGLVFGTGGITLAGFAAASMLGGGPSQAASGAVGVAATTPGAGGQGTATNVSVSAKLAGNGGPAIVMVWEYA